jgi:excisionase family DNA binding protein
MPALQDQLPWDGVWLTLAHAAVRADTSVKTIRRRIASGDLAAYTCGAHGLRVKAADVDAMMRRVPTA